MSSAQGIELRTVGRRQDDQPSVHDNPTIRDVIEGGKSTDPETPKFVSSSAVSPTGDDGPDVSEVSASQAKTYRWRSRVHFAALCYSYFLEGWNDGTLGPLLPRIQSYYDIGFDIVSLLFVFMTLGFIGGAMANVYLNQRIGFGKVMVIGAILQLVGYVMVAPAGPFALMNAGVTFAGLGIAMQMAQCNGFVGSLKQHVRLHFGMLHACYGLGAFVSPLVATRFSTSQHWSFHYVVAASIAASNIVILALVFRLRRQEDVLADAGQVAPLGESAAQAHQASSGGRNVYTQILRVKEVHLLSIFCLIYVGVEVSLGGWIVTFIEEKRGGNATAGYISSGFFGGLMLGRIVFLWFNRKLGERWSILTYGALAISLEVTVWTVPSLVENAVAVSLIGLFMGPMYPIMMNHSTALLPHWLRTGSMGYIAGIGQTGSAVLPLVTGLLASKFGIGSLQPLLVSMMSAMLVIWAVVPRARRFE
ncbi:MFS general substrate transporter [Fomitopsis serialis]|uniref:MFS general substrate transporter n=1 Tax=Fomitopsis serialis TaxID=139415 RepID=UPI00200827B3|nr:MFS general substrate transporter [Neoantrodia serialis]KAH9934819.1 MFS general substrate transporter [Neoantrodia serialis]